MVGTKEWYRANREVIKAKARERMAERRRRDPDGVRAYQKAIYQRNRTHNLLCAKRYNERITNEFFYYYGSICTCCGENDRRFLTLEHLNRDGQEHRKRVGSMNRVACFNDLKRRGWPREGYTVLCFNCNLGKAHNKGTCPHVQKQIEVFIGQTEDK